MDLILLAGTGAAIATGLAGVFVSRLPGTGLVWAAVLVWASLENTSTAWLVLAFATVIALASHISRQLLAGRRFDELVAPVRNIAIAAALGAAGYLAARTLGMVAGFAAGIYVTERRRLRILSPSRHAVADREIITRDSVIELIAGLLITTAWLIAIAG